MKFINIEVVFMRLTILLALSPIGLAAAPVPAVLNQWYRLPAGQSSFTLYHSTDAAACASASNPTIVRLNASWTRAKVRFQQDYENTTGTMDSANPAQFCFDTTWGGIRVVFQQLDGSNNPVGAASDPLVINPVPPVDQTGTITMPQEIVGFPGKIKSQVLVIPGGTNLSGYQGVSFQINNYSYNQKGSFSINGSPFTYFESCLWETTLASGISAGALSIPVVDGTFLPGVTDAFGQILIDNEIIDIGSRSGNTLSVLARSDYLYSGRGGKQLIRPGYYFPGFASFDTLGVAVSHSAGARVANFDLQMRYGGVGGGFSTMQFYCAVPGRLQVGNNTLHIRLDHTKNDSSGFRVIANHLLGAGGAAIESNAFVDEDPTTWIAPSGGNAANGLTAFQTATLSTPSLAGYTNLAHCSDCHSVDGRDLQYFAFSNNSIIVRSLFHKLTLQQSKDIAAYIRSLATADSHGNAVAPWGRPWNPPYQSGPGLDALPVSRWAAGAGISAVLARDRDMFGYLMPPYDGTGTISVANTNAAFATTRTVNPHNLPIAMQFPDWNHWLPKIHPLDAFGSSAWNGTNPVEPGQPNGPTAYSNIRSAITPGSCSSYASNGIGIWGTFHSAAAGFVLSQSETPYGFNGNYSALQGRKVQGISSWHIVKTWEIMQEYGLEGCYQTLFSSPLATPTRGWPVFRLPFDNSPNIQHFPIYHDMTGSLWNIEDTPWAPQAVQHGYISMIWYFLQMQLNVDNKQQTGQIPIDYGYMTGVMFNLPYSSHGQAGMGAWLMMTVLQTMHGNSSSATAAPEFQDGHNTRGLGQFWVWPDVTTFLWQELTNAEIGALMTGVLRTILDFYATLTPTQIRAMDGSTSTMAITKGSYGPLSAPPLAANDFYLAIPIIAHYAGHTAIIDEAADWAATIWPGPSGNLNNWNSLKTDTCERDFGYTRCVSSH